MKLYIKKGKEITCIVCGGEVMRLPLDVANIDLSYVWRCNDCDSYYYEKKDNHQRPILELDKKEYYD